MIITANSVQHTLGVQWDFIPRYLWSVKFFPSYNGFVNVIDRGAAADKYECAFTLKGLTPAIEAFIDDLRQETGQVTIDTEGIKIFGSGVLHSGTFTCNLITKEIDYPIRDIKVSTVRCIVRVVSAISYDPQYSTDLPERLFYQWPIDRSIDKYSSPWNAIEIGDFGNTSVIDSAGDVMINESVSIRNELLDNEFGQLHRFVSNNRGVTFTLDTNTHLRLFLNSTSTQVKITSFRYRPKGFNMWEVKMVLANNV